MSNNKLTDTSFGEYVKNADELVQEVLNTWARQTEAGNGRNLTGDFKALLDLACEYHNAKRLADNHRQFNCLTEQEAANEEAAREAFARAYKAMHDKP